MVLKMGGSASLALWCACGVPASCAPCAPLRYVDLALSRAVLPCLPCGAPVACPPRVPCLLGMVLKMGVLPPHTHTRLAS